MEPAHDRKTAAAERAICRRNRRAVVCVGGFAALASGIMLFFLGVPLLLGSRWGVAIAPIFAVLFAVRARIEECALIEGLPDYADYAARVRYRLVPGLW
jgi:hypothetical protein